MRHRTTIAATVAISVLALAFGVVIATGDPGRPPWERADNTVDESKLPATEGVIDHTGAFVGTVKTSDDLAGIYPLPVYGSDGELVGHVGENGFWRLGEPEPIDEDSITIVEEFDVSGQLMHTRTIDGFGEVIHSWFGETVNEEAPIENPQLPE